MSQEQQGQDFQQMLTTMKITQFRQKQQERRLSQMFSILKSNKTEKQPHPHYKMTLYCKVMQGIMLYGVQLRQFEQRLEDVYVDILLRKHFEAFREFKKERENNVELVREVRKCRGFGQFMLVAEERVNLGKLKQFIKKRQVKLLRAISRTLVQKSKQKARAYKQQQSQVKEFKYKTDTNFFPSRQTEKSKYLGGFNRTALQDSRKSAYSAFSMNSEQKSKRKFTAVKQLPQLSDLKSVLEHEKEAFPSEVFERKEQINSSRTEKASVIEKSPTKQSQLLPLRPIIRQESKQESPVKQTKKVQQLVQPKREQSNPLKENREQILSLISCLKVFQISSLRQIIDEYSSTLKHESLINEKHYLSLSQSTLRSIIDLKSPQ